MRNFSTVPLGRVLLFTIGVPSEARKACLTRDRGITELTENSEVLFDESVAVVVRKSLVVTMVPDRVTRTVPAAAAPSADETTCGPEHAPSSKQVPI
jgi:hypothetical protein